MNRSEFYKRIRQIFRPEQLRKKKAIVIGLGSGGSRVATELGRLGVQQTLIDLPGELLKEHNIVRHVLGYKSLGKPKITELAKHIHNLNPGSRTEGVELDITSRGEEFRLLVEKQRPDLLLACTDNEPSKYIISEVGVCLNVPVAGGGVYEGGVAGEVYITKLGTACYGCIAAQLQRDLKQPRKKPIADYSNLDRAELRSTSALNVDISQIALVHARVALNILLDGKPDLLGIPPEVNFMVFANRRVPGYFDRPLHTEFYAVPRRPDCLVCGGEGQNVTEKAERILGALA